MICFGSDSSDDLKNIINQFTSNNDTQNTSNNENSSNNSSDFNIDFDTIMKIKTLMDAFNSKNDPRSNLLLSLKPYLKDSRKQKLDQYVGLLNMSQVFELLKNTGGDKNVGTQ